MDYKMHLTEFTKLKLKGSEEQIKFVIYELLEVLRNKHNIHLEIVNEEKLLNVNEENFLVELLEEIKRGFEAELVLFSIEKMKEKDMKKRYYEYHIGGIKNVIVSIDSILAKLKK